MLSTTSNTPQRVGRRQPFGFLTDNTLSKSSSKGSSDNVSKLGSSNGSNNSSSALSSLSNLNNKNESSKKNVRGILKSIVKRSRTGSFSSKRSERSTSSTWSIPTEEEVSESPTKKSRGIIDEEKEELKLAAETVDVMANSNNVVAAAARLPSLDTNNTEEVESIFKPSRTFHYDDEMEDMLEIKLANPVLDDDSIDDDDAEEIIGRKGLQDVDDTQFSTDSKWQNIMWSNRVHEDKHGFQIHVDHEDYLNIIEKRTDTI